MSDEFRLVEIFENRNRIIEKAIMGDMTRDEAFLSLTNLNAQAESEGLSLNLPTEEILTNRYLLVSEEFSEILGLYTNRLINREAATKMLDSLHSRAEKLGVPFVVNSQVLETLSNRMRNGTASDTDYDDSDYEESSEYQDEEYSDDDY